MKPLLWLALLFAPVLGSAQNTPAGLAVHVSTECDSDLVGQRVAFKVREAIRRSSSMRVADSYNDSIIQLSLVCMSPNENDRGNISRYSYSITFYNHKGYYDYQLTHGVAHCGTQRVDECADGMAANIDQKILELKQRMSDGSFNPFASPPAGP